MGVSDTLNTRGRVLPDSTWRAYLTPPDIDQTSPGRGWLTPLTDNLVRQHIGVPDTIDGQQVDVPDTLGIDNT